MLHGLIDKFSPPKEGGKRHAKGKRGRLEGNGQSENSDKERREHRQKYQLWQTGEKEKPLKYTSPGSNHRIMSMYAINPGEHRAKRQQPVHATQPQTFSDLRPRTKFLTGKYQGEKCQCFSIVLKVCVTTKRYGRDETIIRRGETEKISKAMSKFQQKQRWNRQEGYN